MAGGSLSRRHKDRISIKQRHSRSKGTFFELSEFDYTDNAPQENDSCKPRNSDTRSSEMLSTTDLLSTVSHVWNHVREPLSLLLPRTNSAVKPEVIRGVDILHSSIKEETPCALSTDDQPSSSYKNSRTNLTKVKHRNFGNSEVNGKKSCPRLNYDGHSFWRVYHAKSSTMDAFYKGNCASNTGIPPRLGILYEWMNGVALGKPNNQDNSTRIEQKRVINWDAVDCTTNPASSSVEHTDDAISSANLTSRSFACNLEPVDLPCSAVANLDPEASENEIAHSKDIEVNDYEIYITRFGADREDTALASSSHDCRNRTIKCDDDGLCAHQKDQGIEFNKAYPTEVDVSFSEQKKPQYAFAKQEHAFAGAMAGIFVSLCLHPMDTVKTVIQSCRADHKPLHHVSRSILSERGVTGLYRGISSNILTSAPISALYTFTYESVKKTLLPFLPKEYHSLAHCTAGGCASIATSFIFTPSERIKQQMQVGSHYRNCWNALIEVVQKGGLSSLYTGWGAVLCRNVPHSIIKFYSYESLKTIMLPSAHPDAQAHTVVTLVCGGLAGSMASLFTTPFDVVKTRLQTQIPGSMTLYNGVFSTLREVQKHEGLKGLYKGLTPRLVMYMIQGALFFASYESFKRLFSLEIPKLTQAAQREQNVEDDSLSSLASVAA